MLVWKSLKFKLFKDSTIDEDVEQTLVYWSITNSMGVEYVSLVHFHILFKIPDSEDLGLALTDDEQACSLDALMPTLITPRGFNRGLIFITHPTLLSIVEVITRLTIAEKKKVKQFILDNFVQAAEKSTVSESKLITNALKMMSDVFTKKDQMGNASIRSNHEFMKAWDNLKVLGETHVWIANLLKDLSTLPFDEAYNIYAKYDTILGKYNSVLLITQLIMFIHAEMKFEKPEKTGRRNETLMSIVSYKLPKFSPLYSLTFSQMHRTIPKRTILTSKELTKKKIAMGCVNFKKLSISDTTKYIYYPNNDIFHIDNAGVKFDNIYTKMKIKSLFLFELANREAMNKGGGIAALSLEN